MIMNTVNDSTSFSPFQLLLGRSPHLIPPFLQSLLADDHSSKSALAADLVKQIDTDVLEVQDNLFLAKVNQATLTNRSRDVDPAFAVSDKVLLSTFHRRRDYMQRGDHRVAKFMVCWDGPYHVLHAYPESFAYTLDLPAIMKILATFHASLLKPWKENDVTLFPGRQHAQPGPIITDAGKQEWKVEEIIDHHPRECGF
ncbi:Transposon Ty3-G Gag-Pol polyprotein [Sparassis crispa]|uniref:Transposon Ty3-G Gag-Pol polyprotein n=1 Tax=Sparassis crispa TaxID=139825 RepID=A0A401H339_9APHY|nr:Transposon Ty3-G Gag-Pol polyprotein [Sparassis crispa]GBE88838.1 Transposon Ty3-G Gag-Pol polyprotein [Sparassis crispa]